MSWLTELLFNAGSGGLFGLLGTGVTAWIRLREKREDNRFAEAMADRQAASAEAAAAWAGFSASQSAAASDMSEKVSPWAANVRAVTRPFLTGGLVVGAFVSLFFVPADQRRDLIASFQMLTGTAVAWWFGSRMMTQIRPAPAK